MRSPFRDELASALARLEELTLENQALRRRLAWVERRSPVGGSRAYYALPLVSAALSCGVAIGLFALRADSAQRSAYADDGIVIAGLNGYEPARPLPALVSQRDGDEQRDDVSDGHLSVHDAWEVVHRHDGEVRRACGPRGVALSAKVTLRIVVTPSGRVSSAVATSDDPLLERCVEGEARRWGFPSGGSADLPFRFVLR